MRFELKLFPKQLMFVNSTGKATEVLYGGAAGGGKSYGQLCDAMIKSSNHGSTLCLSAQTLIHALDYNSSPKFFRL